MKEYKDTTYAKDLKALLHYVRESLDLLTPNTRQIIVKKGDDYVTLEAALIGIYEGLQLEYNSSRLRYEGDLYVFAHYTPGEHDES